MSAEHAENQSSYQDNIKRKTEYCYYTYSHKLPQNLFLFITFETDSSHYNPNYKLVTEIICSENITIRKP